MDISDGLLLDLSRLCAASGVGAALDLAAVPVSADLAALAEALGVDALALALSGGEDYELVATMAPEAAAVLKGTFPGRFGLELTDIGEIVAEEGLCGGDGSTLEPKGWDHFA
jgi:thiamine-monophosphate kinase